MSIVKCKVCSKEFKVKPFWLKRGWGKFCSKSCQYFSQRNGQIVECFTCGKQVYKSQRKINHSKSGKYFCSKSCQTLWRNSEYSGERHPNWNGGIYSYRDILKRHKEEICSLCHTIDKRILAVHHIDRNRKNNNIENLVYLCHNCHYLVHHDRLESEKLKKVLSY